MYSIIQNLAQSEQQYFCPSGWRLRESQATHTITCCIYAHRLVLQPSCHFLYIVSLYIIIISNHMLFFLQNKMDQKMFQRFSSLVDIAMRMHKKLRTKHAFSVLFALSCNALLYVYRLEHTSRNSCTVILDARSQGAIVSFLYLPLSFTKCHI